jgi:glycosyltransferase involved in cell wall biosynthesis
MRIAISTPVIQRGRSGVGQYVLALVRAMLPAAERHAFTLFVLEDDIPLFDFAAGAMRIEPVAERHRPPVRNILWHQISLPMLVTRLGIEVLHVPSYRRMVWSKVCALVATVHDLAPFRFPGKYDALRMLYGRIVGPRLARRQDAVIAVSQHTGRDVEDLFHVKPGHLSVVPNGLDHERFNLGWKAGACEAVCVPRGIRAPFFLYVSRLEHPAKNHTGLIDAFNRFKAATGSEWLLVFAGGDWHGVEAIRAAAAASPYAKDIVFLGFVSNGELPDWYRAADVFVCPSLYEGFGLPPVEAMACGCPVLSSEAGALGETVAGAAGVLDPRDPEQMQSQLTRATRDPEWLRELRLAGLRRAREFSWVACAQATLDVYSRALVTYLRGGIPPPVLPTNRPRTPSSNADGAPSGPAFLTS